MIIVYTPNRAAIASRCAPTPDVSRPFTTEDRGENDHALEQDSIGCLSSCLAMDR